MYDSVSQMEPLFPSKRAEQLADLSVELVRKSAALGGYFRSHTREALVALLRQMNSYYSNLIEGHHTNPIDIERAMQHEYLDEPAKRALQLESKAHNEVQQLIEDRLKEFP
jgi:Fic family protein